MSKDIVAVVLENHAALAWLSERLPAADRRPAQRLLFDEYAKALGGHLRAIDAVVIPALRSKGWRNLSSAVLVGHVELKGQLADLLTVDAEAPDFEGAFAALVVNVATQAERENKQLLPLLSRQFNARERLMLGGEALEHRERVMGDGVPSFADSQPAAELVAEARLVLGGGPVLRRGGGI